MTNEELLALPDDEYEAHWDDKFAAISCVYSLRPGHTLTQEDFDAIQKFDADFREGEQTAVDAFHAGYKQGLRDGGSADIEKMQAKLDVRFCEHAVDRTMRKLAEERCAKLAEVVAEARRAIGEHSAPDDCYATGPLTGDPIRDLVQCPACAFLALYEAEA